MARDTDTHVYFPPEALHDYTTFAAARADIYSPANARDVAKREAALVDLLTGTLMGDGTQTLEDRVLDEASAVVPGVDARRLAVARGLSGFAFEVILSGADSGVRGVYMHEELPLDRRRFASDSAMAALIGYGPKQNDTSGRTHTGNTLPRYGKVA
jgi:hypothetical protein